MIFLFKVGELPIVPELTIMEDFVLRCDYVKLGSKRIKTGSVFTLFQNNNYIFQQVQHILIYQDEVKFICRQFENYTYDAHVDGYIIDDRSFNLVLLDYKNKNIAPNRLHTMTNGKQVLRIKL